MVTGSIKPRVNTFEVLGCGQERIPQGIRRTKGEPCSSEARSVSDLQGSRTSGAGHLSGWGLDVTMHVFLRSPEHQDLAYVYLRFRSPFQVRLLREA